MNNNNTVVLRDGYCFVKGLVRGEIAINDFLSAV